MSVAGKLRGARDRRRMARMRTHLRQVLARLDGSSLDDATDNPAAVLAELKRDGWIRP